MGPSHREVHTPTSQLRCDQFSQQVQSDQQEGPRLPSPSFRENSRVPRRNEASGRLLRVGWIEVDGHLENRTSKRNTAAPSRSDAQKEGSFQETPKDAEFQDCPGDFSECPWDMHTPCREILLPIGETLYSLRLKSRNGVIM